LDRVDWLLPIRAAAAEKLPASVTAAKLFIQIAISAIGSRQAESAGKGLEAD
jgi:hypothetical protein